MAVELKPCPLCGGEAKLDKEEIFCDYCYLSLKFENMIYNGEAKNLREAKEMGIELWQRREGV